MAHTMHGGHVLDCWYPLSWGALLPGPAGGPAGGNTPPGGGALATCSGSTVLPATGVGLSATSITGPAATDNNGLPATEPGDGRPLKDWLGRGVGPLQLGQ